MGRIFYWLFVIFGIVTVSVLLFLGTTKPATAPSNPASAAATQAVKHDVASRANVSESEVKIVSVTAKDWPNSCLGINRSDVVCAQVVIPGYDIKASAKGTTYDYHTNTSGSAVVLANSY